MNCFGQPKLQQLIVAENKPKDGNHTFLVSYKFRDGILTSKDTILGAGPNVKYQFGENIIYKNRYVISSKGNVIDIKSKALVVEDSDDFISASGDTLIFHRNNLFSGTGYLLLDLVSGKYNFINDKERNTEREERSSPDKKYYLSIDKTEIPYKIWLCDSLGDKKIVVSDAGHGPIYFTSELPTIETHWLDNNSFLYAVHQAKSNSRKNAFSKVTLRRFFINNNSDTVFFIIDSVSKGYGNASFYLNKIGQTIYKTSGGEFYRVDTVNSKLSDYYFSEKGYYFSTSIRRTKEGTIIKYKNVDIGTHWTSNEVASDGIIAMAYGKVSSNLYFTKGIKIWSNLTKAWTTIDIPWLSRVIGWVNEE